MSSPYAIPPSELGKAIKARRLAADLTQQDAADQLDVSVRAIQLWEKGSTPAPQTRRRIRRWLSDELEASAA